ncbi:MAG: DUF1800 domain-containing protein [Phycisphaerales bacterium]
MPAAAREPGGPASRRITTSTQPILKKDFGFEQARHLLWRAGFGGTPGQIQTLVAWGPEKSVSHLVDFEKVPCEAIKGDEFDKDIMRPQSAEDRAALRRAAQAKDEDALARQRLQRQNAEQADRQQVRELQLWWLKRMIESPRPLEERMTLFWHGHFATSYRTIEDSYHMFAQNLFFRKNCVGNFGELLFGIIRDPAMLAYLDQNDSRKNKPNENLAREIMELFSLGVGNYTEKDIKEGARALTGYTFRDDEFVFEKGNHDTASKAILGSVAAHDGDSFVKTILENRACARFIATKLYRNFVHDYPSGSPRVDEAAKTVINDLASTLLSSRYEIKPVLRKLFLSQHFYDGAIIGEQIKSPVQLIVGAIRSLNTPVRDMTVLAEAGNAMGQSIFFPPSVKGWDGGRSWINTSTMFIRQNIAVFLLTGRRPQGRDGLADQEKFDPTVLLSQLADAYPGSNSDDPEKTIDAILAFTLGRTQPASRGTLVEFVKSKGNTLDQQTLTQLMLLVTALPEYQLC